ncbi:G-protein coupled receptor 183-like [Corythoichthys intestinalis]|uniref:G-protein coupled receptor 183-like n=1 Tax=Corythoichthys intestinalis TaxID=161448 RepID=UPI0025A6262E|nr:G-protein coupled receptor 183-like [Corythoichthys intestinalis]
MAGNFTNQQIKDIYSVAAYSDELCNVIDIEHPSLYAAFGTPCCKLMTLRFLTPDPHLNRNQPVVQHERNTAHSGRVRSRTAALPPCSLAGSRQTGVPAKMGGVNVLTFLFAQFDRYLAVCHPFFYNRYISRSLVIGVCAFCWIYTYSILTVQNMVPISKAAQINAFGVMTLQIIVLVKVLMTIKLYVIARNHLAREPPSAERDNKRESLRIIVFVVICFLALWCPSFVNIIVRQLTRTGIRFRNEATNLFAIMARLNALVTPALYIWGSPALRGAVWRVVWRRVCPRRRARVDLSSKE